MRILRELLPPSLLVSVLIILAIVANILLIKSFKRGDISRLRAYGLIIMLYPVSLIIAISEDLIKIDQLFLAILDGAMYTLVFLGMIIATISLYYEGKTDPKLRKLFVLSIFGFSFVAIIALMTIILYIF